MPHQVPPEGEWYLWLLLAGRMSGKTEAASRFVSSYARRSPCRIAIIAPTLGDARQSCVEGPSGLLAHDRSCRFVRSPEYVVRWPNGSRADLFGAYTPEDVERLRAGGNRHLVWCVAEGTLVATENGAVPIERVRPGDRVWTRSGLAPVSAAGPTRADAEVLRIATADASVVVTPDHRVWLEGRGWVQAQDVAPSDRVLVWNDTDQSPDRLPGSSGPVNAGGVLGRATTRTGRASFFTEWFGRLRSARWMTTRCSTTSTTTRRTMPRFGRGRIASLARSLAPVAGSSTRAPGCGPSSAPRPVPQSSSVVSVERVSHRVQTYDLTIDGEPEFFAGGILVHNCEELAAWRQLEGAWNQMELGLRLGPRPQVVASTTPKPKPMLRKLMGAVDTVLTRATSADNPHIAGHVRERLFEKYEGTRTGRQELYAEFLEDVEGALWRRAWFDRPDFRIEAVDPASIERTVVALDPASGADEGDEQAITVASLLHNGHYAVQLSDGMRTSPDLWLRRALAIATEYDADALVYERNYGHAFLDAMVAKAVEDQRHPIAYRGIDATRGKRTRAEPIAMLYEQGKVHHLGAQDVLEDQMSNYAGAPGESSPDRLDATVYALTDLAKGRGVTLSSASALTAESWA